MPRQEVKFDFPDPDKEAAEKEDELDVELEGTEEEEAAKKVAAKKPVAKDDDDDDFEVEVYDDTPKADRGRKPSAPPEEVSEDELNEYSEKVRKRISHFTKGYHDERRAKEKAEREREELEKYARAVTEENNTLKGSVDQSRGALIEQAKKAAQSEVDSAKRMYKEAYESGDTDALVEAQDALTTAKIRAERANSFKNTPLQKPASAVQVPHKEQPRQSQPVTDERVTDWASKNVWFGDPKKPVMTAFALGTHQELVAEGIDPRSDKYYSRLDASMRKTFPDAFEHDGDASEEQPLRRKPGNVVAPATRSAGPKKIRLSQTQQGLARKLGISNEQYAKQVAKLERQSNE